MRKGGREDVKNSGSGKGEEERVTSLFTTTCKMKSTKVQTLGRNIATFGLETPLHAYVLGMPSIEPRSRTICIVLSMHVYM